MRSNLILTGGINHDFVDTAHAIADVLADVQFRSTVIDDMSEGFELLANAKFDLITLFALRWRMLDDDKYIPDRARWAYEIGDRDRRILSHHVINGGGLLGLHTAAICFDTWPEWPELLGAAWVWRETFHPPPTELLVRKAEDHAVTRGLEDFLVIDELYHNLWSSPNSVPLLMTESAEDGSQQQIAFASEASGGRVVYNALGHDRESVTTKGHARFLQQAANWCAPG